MAEEHNHTFETTEVEDRGLLDFVSKKKEEKVNEEVLHTGVKNLHIEEENLEDEKKHTLLDKLHRSDGSSSGSLSDEDEADEEKKEMRKKKGLKEKLNGDYKAEEDTVVVTQEAVNVDEPDDSTIVVEKVVTEAVVETPTVLEEEKEDCLEEMMEKLKEHKKILEEGAVESIAPVVKDGAVESTAPLPPASVVEPEVEKKSFLAKIKEKLPGYHKSGGEEGEKAVAASE